MCVFTLILPFICQMLVIDITGVKMSVSYRTLTSMRETQLSQNEDLAEGIRSSVAYLKDVCNHKSPLHIFYGHT